MFSVGFCRQPAFILTPGLSSLYMFLETRKNRKISSDTLAELAETVFKNNIFEFD